MNLWQLFLTAFLVGFSGAMMPGPLLTLNIKESIRRGAWTGPLLVCGHALLELVLLVAVLFGFGRLLGLAWVKAPIGLAGGAVLLWMAQGMLREALTHPSLSGGDSPRGTRMPPVLAGAVVSLSNPYWSVWWASIGLSYLARARELALAGVAAFYIGHILADFTWYSAVAIAAAGGGRLLSDRAYRAVIFLCGLFLVCVGLWFVDSAFGFAGLRAPSAHLRGLLDIRRP